MPDFTSTAQAVAATPEIAVTGDPDVWQLVCKASCSRWAKSTKAMATPAGVVVQVTTEHRDVDGVVTACAEALCGPIPGTTLEAAPGGKSWRIVYDEDV
jgi:hypothetical protein